MGSALYINSINCPKCKKEKTVNIDDDYKDGLIRLNCNSCEYVKEINYDVNKLTSFKKLKQLNIIK